MPPLNSRSTGACRIALIRLGGVISVTPSSDPSMPNAARTWGLTGIALCSRLYTPPPSLISDAS